MDIDKFLDRESESVDAVKKAPAEHESLKLEHPAKAAEAKEQPEKKDYFNEIKSALEKNDFTAAEKLYYGLWAELKGSVAWNQNFHDNLIKTCAEIRNTLGRVYSETSRKKVLVKTLIKKMKENISKGNYQAALSQYSELIDVHNEIPSFLFEEKRTMHNEILGLYMGLKQKINFIFLSRFNSSLKKLRQMINNARLSLKKMELDNARNIYLEITKFYTGLPAGFLSAKVGIAGDILELYKEISISLEIRNLESQLHIEKTKKRIEKPNLFRHAPLLQTKFHEDRNEIEKLREMSLRKGIRSGKPGDDAMKRLGAIAKEGSHDLKNLLIKRRLQRAKLKIDTGLHNEAKKEFESVLRLDPGNTEAKNMLNKAVPR